MLRRGTKRSRGGGDGGGGCGGSVLPEHLVGIL